jgi:mono/diheme cytochrome c family protein
MNRKPAWFFAGAIAFAIVLAVSLFVGLKTQARGFSAREQPTAFEAIIARTARRTALPEDAREKENPVAESSEVLSEAEAHWAGHCAGCHANNGSGDTDMGKHMYPPAPDMRLPATQNRTDGELFYIIQNGIRLTGMPSWGSRTNRDDQDSWMLVRFIRHLPQLTGEELGQMDKLNPKTPGELAQQQEEEQFLNGETPAEAPKPHKH